MATDFPGVMARLMVHATTAADALTSPIKDVAIAYPKAGSERSIRIFWGGETKPRRMGEADEVLNGKMTADLIVVIVFWPLGHDSEDLAESTETEARAFTVAFRTAVLGDARLNGQITDLYLEHGATDFPVLAGTQYRTLTFELIADYSEYAIATV